MSDLAPTPETDAMENFFVALCPAYSAAEYTNLVGLCTEQLLAKCRALERERNAARAAHNDALLRLHVTTAERDELREKKRDFTNGSDVIAAQVKRIQELETKLDGWFVERDDATALAKNYAERMARSDADLATVQQAVARLTAERDSLSEALERNCVQYARKQQALIAERDSLRADLTKMAADLDYAQDEAFKGGV